MKKRNNIKRKIKKPNFNFNLKLNKQDIIALVILFLILIISCLINGKTLAIIQFLGVLIILGVSILSNKIKKNKKRRKILNIILILFFTLAILVCIGIVAFCIWIVNISPEFDITKLTKKEATIVYDKDGNEYARFGSELRENITYDDLPEVFIDALIATEDSRFFQHNGIDAPRFLKATLGQLANNSDAGGASTLSMQLIKKTYTSDVAKGIEGIVRKFEDIYLAVFKLEKNFTKEEIIEYYVNNFDLGNNAYGVEQASQTFFNKSVKDLNLSEAAMLVGIFNNPTQFNPYKNPTKTYKRRAVVLDLMVSHGYITKEERDYANSIPISSLLAEKKGGVEYQSYKDAVYNELKNKYGINPNTTSVLVYTNMDSAKQKGLDDIFNGNSSYKWIDDYIQSGVAVIDVHNGKIVALGGGRNKTEALTLNYATDAKRQIGSTAKPIFDYGPAIEYLNWSTYQQIVDEPYSYKNGQVIGNSDGQYQGQISMRTALAQSRNIPALKAFHAVSDGVGNNKILEFATNLGIKPETNNNGEVYESASLGALDGTTPLQMAAAYATFANGGTYYEPTTINKIVYRDTNEVIDVKNEGKRAMSEATAYMITSMLQSAVNEGISNGAKINGVNVAAKTGTSNFDKTTKQKYHLASDAVNDAWIVGYDPDYALSMWYGYPELDSKYYNHQIKAVVERGKLYRALGNVVFTKNNKEFEVPASVSKVCLEKGHMEATLPSNYTPQDQIVCEYFRKGTEPNSVSTAYVKLTAPTNLKATYDNITKKLTITWDKVKAPDNSENSYGAFGYNVYYGDTLLGFTDENKFIVDTNTAGLYKVKTTYQNYTNNQSDFATYEYTTTVEKPDTTQNIDTTKKAETQKKTDANKETTQ